MTQTQILIADDHDVVRKGIRSVLETHHDWHIVAEAKDGREAVRLAEELHPQIVILDVSMPELNGLDAARQILKTCPHAKVLFLSMMDSQNVFRDALALGACGYILKGESGKVLIRAVEGLASGSTFFTPAISNMLLQDYLAQQTSVHHVSPRHQPSMREREIIQMLAEGKCNKEIAVALNISVKTVETHRANIRQKLDLHSITDILRYAVKTNIVAL